MDKQNFTGTVLRVEPTGFAIVKFDRPIGPSENTHGLFSLTLGSTSTVPYRDLRPGVHVEGEASPEWDSRKLATVQRLYRIHR